MNGGLPAAKRSMGILTDHDIYLFREGTHATLYQRLGYRPVSDRHVLLFAAA